jgi:hypothetical protein
VVSLESYQLLIPLVLVDSELDRVSGSVDSKFSLARNKTGWCRGRDVSLTPEFLLNSLAQ